MPVAHRAEHQCGGGGAEVAHEGLALLRQLHRRPEVYKCMHAHTHTHRVSADCKKGSIDQRKITKESKRLKSKMRSFGAALELTYSGRGRRQAVVGGSGEGVDVEGVLIPWSLPIGNQLCLQPCRVVRHHEEVPAGVGEVW